MKRFFLLIVWIAGLGILTYATAQNRHNVALLAVALAAFLAQVVAWVESWAARQNDGYEIWEAFIAEKEGQDE